MLLDIRNVDFGYQNEQPLLVDFSMHIKKGEFVRLDEVRSAWLTQVGKAIALLRAKFENELPPILSGQDAQGIREECAEAIDEVCKVLHNGGETTP